jgi:hypothetical protein
MPNSPQSKKTIISRLAEIQRELKAPKNQFNKFGNYKYRSCEDILEAVKPLLNDLVLTIGDEIVNVGDRYYIKATAVLTNGEQFVENSAFARESLSKKGMDDAQVSGSASSYARKYALNGLFSIDDQKDSDSLNDDKEEKSPNKRPAYMATKKQVEVITGLIKDGHIDQEFIKKALGKEVKKFSELTMTEASRLITDGLIIKQQDLEG